MDKVIALLKEELVIAEDLEKLLDKEKESLTSATSGEEAAKFAGKIDGILRLFRKVQASEIACYTEMGVQDLQGALETESDIAKVEEANRLADALTESLERARERGILNKALLERNTQFAEFSINVMRNATASGTYAKDTVAADGVKPAIDSRKLFEKDV